MLIGWFKLRGFAHMGIVVKIGRGIPDLSTEGMIKQVNMAGQFQREGHG